jgi:endonuclease/exonuclease/phosphatase (EEP) superfamily protein YafD
MGVRRVKVQVRRNLRTGVCLQTDLSQTILRPSFNVMNRNFLLCPLLTAIFIALAPSLFAQTSPWPFSSRPNAANPAGSRSLTLAFWNIEWFPGRRTSPSKSEETSQINAVHNDIKKLDADIIGMEEVRDFINAGVAVQTLPGFKVDVCANFPPREGQTETQQVAIASRLQPLSAWAEEWKAGAVTPPRGFAFAAYQIAPKQLVLVYALHLKSNRGDIKENVPMRQESMRQLQSHREAMEKAYAGLGAVTWIVGGDFNTSMDDPRYAQETTLRGLMESGFAWGWQNLQPSARTTLPADKGFPAASFDHIFYRGATLRKAHVENTSPLSSDHHAIVAAFDLPAPAK